MINKEKKFRYVFQHDETARIVIKHYTLEEIELQKFIEVGSRYTIVSRDLYVDLNDHNEKEIYEYDVVRVCIEQLFDYVEKIGVVEYGDTRYMIDFPDEGVSIGLACQEVQVIGNIYENHELLKTSEQ